MEAEAAEQMRAEMEKERMRKVFFYITLLLITQNIQYLKVEQEKDRMMKERREAEKRQHQEVDENRIRKKQLRESLNFLLNLKLQIREIYREEQVEREVCLKLTYTNTYYH